MRLSLRLSAIADMVTTGNRLVDVGCDHGYLPVYLVQKGRIPGAIAMDVRPGPLKRAEEHIREYGLEAYIETRLSDGLEALKPGEGDSLVIAGMGGPLMERILRDGADKLAQFQELILQPQSDIRHFRRFLMESGYVIVREEMVLEDGKYYPMMKAAACGRADEPGHTRADVSGCVQTDEPGGTRADAPVCMQAWEPEEEAYGKLLLQSRHPVLKKYLEKESALRERILLQLTAAPKGQQGERTAERAEEIKEEQRLIAAALKRYESS